MLHSTPTQEIWTGSAFTLVALWGSLQQLLDLLKSMLVSTRAISKHEYDKTLCFRQNCDDLPTGRLRRTPNWLSGESALCNLPLFMAHVKRDLSDNNLLLDLFLNQISSWPSTAQLQVAKICENECIGFNVTNRRDRTISVEKGGQSVAALSVWATVRMDDDPVKNPYWNEGSVCAKWINVSSCADQDVLFLQPQLPG